MYLVSVALDAKYHSDQVCRRGASVEILPGEQLTTLCESTCQDDLRSLRTAILGACTASSDIMVPNKFAYPGELLVDLYLEADRDNELDNR
jgi:hypothetical protein